MSSGCLCDGRYAGCDHPQPCPNPPGGHRSPRFCPGCDQRRITTINTELDATVAQFKRRQAAHADAAAEGLDGWQRYFRGERIHQQREAQ